MIQVYCRWISGLDNLTLNNTVHNGLNLGAQFLTWTLTQYLPDLFLDKIVFLRNLETTQEICNLNLYLWVIFKSSPKIHVKVGE